MSDPFALHTLELREAALPNEQALMREFLARQGLELEDQLDVSLLLMRDGQIIGCGSAAGDVLKCIAVAPDYRGEGALARIVSGLLERRSANGLHHAFVFTTPAAAQLFADLGFRIIGVSSNDAALLEIGVPDISHFLRRLTEKAPRPLPVAAGAVVVNCNPFTLGHRHLIATAASQVEHVYVITVEEDRSVFPFSVRFDLIQRGLADLANVTTLAGGRYVISSATFPTYFLKGRANDLVRIQTRLDVNLFAQHIAPTLRVATRFAGTEPHCDTTRAYNAAMAEVLATHGIDLIEIPRQTLPDGRVISASAVRKYLAADEWDDVRSMVPETTFEYLRSPAAAPVITRIRHS